MWWYEKIAHQHADINFFIQQKDMRYAVEKYNLLPVKCGVITYGIEIEKSPSPEERSKAKKTIQQQLNISAEKKILLFNGSFNYAPNLHALQAIMDKINPLLQKADFNYQIIICGKDIPAAYLELLLQKNTGILYAGFVEDISLYFKAADLFINPVLTGGGIKTKLVEAIAYGCPAVSTHSGSEGIDAAIAENMLQVCADNNWAAFTTTILNWNTATAKTPEIFYTHFYWGHIVQLALTYINH